MNLNLGNATEQLEGIQTKVTRPKPRNAATQSSISPFFLLGCPRSGTTLLQALLNRHPEIAIPPETKIFCDFVGRSRTIRKSCITRIASDLKLPLGNPDSMLGLDAVTILETIQRLYVKQLERNGVRLVGEKTPEHTSRILPIRTAYPDAPIVAIIRSGFEVAESLTRVPWIRCNPGAAAIIWNYYMRHITNAVDSGITRFHIVRFEELIERPEQVLAEVFQFLGAAAGFESHCLEPNRNIDQWLFPNREFKWKGRATQPIQTHPQEKALSAFSRRLVVASSSAMLNRWNYWDDQIRISPLEGKLLRMLGMAACTWTLVNLPLGRLINEAVHVGASIRLKAPSSRDPN